MILRKPYAFLIRHFKKINFCLLLLAIYICYQNFNLVKFTRSFASSNTLIVEDIIAVLNSTYFIVLVLIILISSVLFYLLKRKDRPIKTYVIIISQYVVLLIFGIYLHDYFIDFKSIDYDIALARTIQGIVFVLSIPQYIILLLLVIRSLGIDLNSFGFKNDEEFKASDEDREEVEVEVAFDKEKFKRNVKMTLRNIGYFIKEHKYQLGIILAVVLLVIGFRTYKYIYVTNKVYSMNQTLSSNYYDIKVNNAYITSGNYRGELISEKKRFVIVDVNIKNQLSSLRNIDAGKFLLYVGDNYYAPTTDYNYLFSDMGPVFKEETLKAKEEKNYFLIYEIEPPEEKEKFLFKYQDVTDSSRLIRIKLLIKDISKIVLKDTKNLNEEMKFVMNETVSKKFKITSFEFKENIPYTYVACVSKDCPVYGGVTSPQYNRTILYMKFNPYGDNVLDMVNIFVKYGKIVYTKGGNTVEEKVTNHVSQKYRGNYLFFDVNNKMVDADNISFVLTFRNNQYIYKLR